MKEFWYWAQQIYHGHLTQEYEEGIVEAHKENQDD